jgi:KaiC/GvpD/RAD55 family RecA-like ATPase
VKNKQEETSVKKKVSSASKPAVPEGEWDDRLKRWVPPGTSSTELPNVLLDLSPNCAKWLTKDPPPARYVVMNYLQEGEVAQVAGQAGTSKTTWTIQLTGSLAGGVPFFGVKNTITRQYRVLYVMLERTRKSFHRRWRKGIDHIAAGIKADGDRAKFYANVKANFTAKALGGKTLALVEWKNQEWVQTPLVDALIAKIIAAAIEVALFDPLSRLYRGEENNAVQAAIIRVFERITQETGCSVMFIHHSGITQRDGPYTGRGGSVLTDNTSETISFREFTGTARDSLGNYKAALRQGEQDAAIVQVEHVRCSDGPKNAKMQFVRSPETGLLRRITTIGQKEAGDLVRDWITDNEQFHKWAANRRFSRRQLVNARTVALGDISEDKAKNLVDEAAKANVFNEVDQRNSYPVYEWKPPSGAVVAHHSAPLHHSKKQGEKHVH